mmetsp:Transcript_37203/g.67403  ORF Transcript_37203/g.67403 Transcript_37203/m.67403 type:complete len:283 (+) Transcript_37203:968-1816(+)
MDRHDVPDGAALRHRSGPAAHQGRAAGRRHLQDHRRQDLHLGRRTRPGGQHRPPGAGPPAGCAGRLQGHLAVHRAQVQRERRWQPGQPQPDLLRGPGAQDGHPRQRHGPDRAGRRGRHDGRRAQQGPGRDVRDDERRPPGRGQPVPRPDRGGLPERRRLRQGPRADAGAVGPQGPGQAGRPHHRPPRRAQDAADRACLRRRRPHAAGLHGAAARQGAEERRRGRAQRGGRRSRAADAHHQGLHHRQRLAGHLALPAGVRRPRLHPRVGHGAVRARRAHQHDL